MATVVKLMGLKELMISINSKVLIIVGDVFHKRQQSLQYLSNIMNTLLDFKSSGIKVFSICGNHDIAFERMDTIDSAPLALLVASNLIIPLRTLILNTSNNYSVSFHGYNYPDEIVPASNVKTESRIKVCVAHRFLNYNFDNFSLTSQNIEDLGYNIYCLGHDHVPYSHTKIGNKVVVRSGSFMRGTSHKFNISRTPVIDTISFTNKISFQRDNVLCKPKEQVFSSELINNSTSEDVVIEDLDNLVESLIENLDNSVNSNVYDYVDQLPENIKNTLDKYLSQAGIYRKVEVDSE
jgi:DNA repair exonuclease SbcCD nuclease subunit